MKKIQLSLFVLMFIAGISTNSSSGEDDDLLEFHENVPNMNLIEPLIERNQSSIYVIGGQFFASQLFMNTIPGLFDDTSSTKMCFLYSAASLALAVPTVYIATKHLLNPNPHSGLLVQSGIALQSLVNCVGFPLLTLCSVFLKNAPFAWTVLTFLVIQGAVSLSNWFLLRQEIKKVQSCAYFHPLYH